MPANNNTRSLQTTIAELEATQRRQTRKLAVVRALWVAVALALAWVALDLMLALPDAVRVAMDVAWLIGPVAVAVISYRRQMRAASRARMLVRRVEDGNPQLGNDLINAVEFNETLTAVPPVAVSGSPELMEQHIQRTANEINEADRVAPLRPPSLSREAWVLTGLTAALVVLAVGFGAVCGVVVVRFVDPFGDHPPFSGTAWELMPAGATVHYGDSLRIEAKATGRRPHNVALVLANQQGRELAAVPMFDAGDKVFFQTVENVREVLQYHVRTANGRSQRFTLGLIDWPRLDTVTVTYDYPAYTHLRSETRLLHEKVLRGYRDTKATLRILSNKPLQGGTLTVCGREYPLTPVEETAVVATVPLTTNGVFTATIMDREGHASRDQLAGKVELVPDGKPAVAVVHPQQDSFALPTAQVTINVEASDDLGVSQVEIFRNHNQSVDARRTLYTGDGREKLVNVLETFDLADLGVQPGDVIEFYVAATDSQPQSPQSAATAAYRVQIISLEEYRSFIQREQRAEQLTQKYEEIREKIEALANEQERLAKQIRDWQEKLKAGALSEADKERLAAAQARQEALAEQAREAMKELAAEVERPPIYDVEKDYKLALAEMAKAVAAAQESMKNAARQMQRAQTAADSTAASDALAKAQAEQEFALDKLGRSSGEFDKGISQPNHDIEQVMRLLEDVERFKQLLGRQKDVERQARSLKDQPVLTSADRARLRALGEEQQTMREELGGLRSDFLKHGAAVEKAYPKMAGDARAIPGEIGRREIEKLLAGAADKLGQPDAPGGHANALAAYEQMQAMFKNCEGGAGQAEQECENRLRLVNQVRLGNTLQQLAKAFQSGSGSGQFGRNGAGASGMAGMAAPFDLFGTEQQGSPARQSSRSGRRDHKADIKANDPGAVAGSIEELTTPKSAPLEAPGGGGERFLEEYRKLIEDYFKRAAEEDR